MLNKWISGWIATICLFVGPITLAAEVELNQIRPEAPVPKGVILMVHGLNLSPSQMLPLAQELSQQGYSVLNVSLSGHQGKGPSEFQAVSRDQWISEFLTAYRLALDEAKASDIPLSFLGYSLGAAIGLDATQTYNLYFSKMILFSPAIQVKGLAQLVKLLFPFPRLKIPSKTPEGYRANQGTPVAAYKALFDSIAVVTASEMDHLNKETLIFLDPKDEMISATATKKLMARKKLLNWKLVPISNDGSTLSKSYHHLTIAREAVGENQWKAIQSEISEFLKQ